MNLVSPTQAIPLADSALVFEPIPTDAVIRTMKAKSGGYIAFATWREPLTIKKKLVMSPRTRSAHGETSEAAIQQLGANVARHGAVVAE